MGDLVSSYGIDTAIKAMRGRPQSIAIFLAPPSQLASPERISNPSSENWVGITHSTLLLSEVSRTTHNSAGCSPTKRPDGQRADPRLGCPCCDDADD